LIRRIVLFVHKLYDRLAELTSVALWVRASLLSPTQFNNYSFLSMILGVDL